MAGSKVFAVGDMLIAITGSPRYDQILKYHVSIEPQGKGQSDKEHLVKNFIDPFRRTLKEYGFSKVESNEEKVDEWMMVGYRGRLYTVYGDFQIGRFVDAFTSIGSGDQYALGAMSVLEGMSPKKRIKKALKAAARFQPGSVLPPFDVKVLG
jgi:ATP-dependent protease HslVU (ClpYQ) peptidase subunit